MAMHYQAVTTTKLIGMHQSGFMLLHWAWTKSSTELHYNGWRIGFYSRWWQPSDIRFKTGEPQAQLQSWSRQPIFSSARFPDDGSMLVTGTPSSQVSVEYSRWKRIFGSRCWAIKRCSPPRQCMMQPWMKRTVWYRGTLCVTPVSNVSRTIYQKANEQPESRVNDPECQLAFQEQTIEETQWSA